MKWQAGQAFDIAAENGPVPGCTVSSAVHSGGGHEVSVFSLAAKTDISAELYRTPKIWLVHEGDLQVTGANAAVVPAGGGVVTPVDAPVGSTTSTGAVYTEIQVRGDTIMNDVVKSGNPFRLADLVPYQEGKIVNMDLAHDDSMKLVVMSFDAGTGLTEHAAPGEALVTALDGEAVIGYEGEEHLLRAGESFKFDAGGRHYVRAEDRFKMSLLLLLG